MSMLEKMTKLLSAQRAAAETVQASIASTRAEIIRVADEMDQVTKMPIPMNDALALVDAELDRLVDIGLSGVVVWPLFNPIGGDRHVQIDAAERLVPGLLALVGRDTLRMAAEAKLIEGYAGRQGITEAERASRLTVLEDEALDLELVEESLIRQAEAAGMIIQRRADADPRAVLAFDRDLPA